MDLENSFLKFKISVHMLYVPYMYIYACLLMYQLFNVRLIVVLIVYLCFFSR